MERKYQFNRSLGMLSRQISKGLGIQMQKCLHEKGFKMTPLEWSIISFLKNNPGSTQQDIVNFLWINKTKVNRILYKLQSDGILERETHGGDKRYNVVNLTGKGSELYKNTLGCAEEALSRAYEGFAREQETLLTDMLIKIKENLTEKSS